METKMKKKVTASVTIHKADGTVISEEINMTEEDKRRFLDFINKEK